MSIFYVNDMSQPRFFAEPCSYEFWYPDIKIGLILMLRKSRADVCGKSMQFSRKTDIHPFYHLPPLQCNCCEPRPGIYHQNIDWRDEKFLSYYFTLSGGYTIPKGTWIMPNVWALHRNPTEWKDPELFIPERHLNEDGTMAPKPNRFSF